MGHEGQPRYKKIKLPRSEWPLLDTYIPTTNNTCRQANPTVYFSQLAAPVTTLRKVAEALLDAWPNVQTRCDFDPATQTYKLGRIDRQSYGSRFMLGRGQPRRRGPLRPARRRAADQEGHLRRARRRLAGRRRRPDAAAGSPARAARAARATGRTSVAGRSSQARTSTELGRPFVLDQADVRTSGTAYPGTMVVYTAAKLRNLVKDDADKVALFIRTATTEGQKAGRRQRRAARRASSRSEERARPASSSTSPQAVGDGGRGADPGARPRSRHRSDTAAPRRCRRAPVGLRRPAVATRPAARCRPTSPARRRAVRDRRSAEPLVDARRPRRSARTSATGPCRCC